MAGRSFPPRSSDQGLSSPSDFGSTAPAYDDELDQDTPGTDGSGVNTPESLRYHDEERRCDMCQHFGPANECEVLKQPVSPQGACEAYRAATPGESRADDDDFDDSGEESYAPVGGYDSDS